uniref:Uncharacterized protein n=1 Tax=Lygus hesperus TaxID=30085 RepID=A0A0K8T378_LYGHE
MEKIDSILIHLAGSPGFIGEPSRSPFSIPSAQLPVACSILLTLEAHPVPTLAGYRPDEAHRACAVPWMAGFASTARALFGAAPTSPALRLRSDEKGERKGLNY